MSTYPARADAIRAADDQADVDHPRRGDGWRAARYAGRLAVLVDAIGVDVDRLDRDEARVLAWLADCDTTSVAGVAALLDRAAGR